MSSITQDILAKMCKSRPSGEGRLYLGTISVQSVGSKARSNRSVTSFDGALLHSDTTTAAIRPHRKPGMISYRPVGVDRNAYHRASTAKPTHTPATAPEYVRRRQ
jgi:hypothetical protein